jgi:hypothetical protein
MEGIYTQNPWDRLFGMPRRLDVVAILRKQLREAKTTVGRLHHAIQALERLGRSRRSRAVKISAAGRRRIAAAQRKRRAKLRLMKKK